MIVSTTPDSRRSRVHGELPQFGRNGRSRLDPPMAAKWRSTARDLGFASDGRFQLHTAPAAHPLPALLNSGAAIQRTAKLGPVAGSYDN